MNHEAVRQGMRSLLEYDHCEEEEACIIREQTAMQEWMQEEWHTVWMIS